MIPHIDDLARLQELANDGDQEGQHELEQWLDRYRIHNDEEEAELERRSYSHFLRAAWEAVEHRPLIWSWHLDAICEHLEALAAGEIRRLCINVPPGMTKSSSCSVYFPPWLWLTQTSFRVLACSAVEKVVMRDAIKCQQVVDSDWYQERYRPGWSWDPSQSAKGYYRSLSGLARTSLTVGQKLVGVDADGLIIDDPLDVRDAVPSRANLSEHVLWYDERASERLRDDAWVLLIMQRLHEADLSGHVRDQDGWVHLVLPAVAEEKSRTVSPLPNRDRREPGELLCRRLTAQKIKERRKALGERGFAAQYQQRPAPAEGAVFRKDWLQFWEGHELPSSFDYTISSWDTTFRGGRSNDWCVGQVWGVIGAHCYLLEQTRKRMGYEQAIEEIRTMAARWPSMRAVLVEKHATGSAIVEALQREIPGIVGITHQGDTKESRAQACTPRWAAKQVWLPHPSVAAWVKKAFLPEILGFPVARHDDQVDAMTQALIWISENQAKLPEVYHVGSRSDRKKSRKSRRRGTGRVFR